MEAYSLNPCIHQVQGALPAPGGMWWRNTTILHGYYCPRIDLKGWLMLCHYSQLSAALISLFTHSALDAAIFSLLSLTWKVYKAITRHLRKFGFLGMKMETLPVAAAFSGLSVFFVILRFCVRYMLIRSVGYDDYMVFLSLVCFLRQPSDSSANWVKRM
jgi:hypothetical protein